MAGAGPGPAWTRGLVPQVFWAGLVPQVFWAFSARRPPAPPSCRYEIRPCASGPRRPACVHGGLSFRVPPGRDGWEILPNAPRAPVRSQCRSRRGRGPGRDPSAPPPPSRGPARPLAEGIGEAGMERPGRRQAGKLLGALFCVRARARAAPRSAAGWPLRGNTGRRLLAPRSRPHSRPPAPPALTLGPQSESAVQNGGAPRRIGGDGTPGLDRPLGARWIPGRDLRSAERFTTTWELRTREREKARERESDGERERERERERAAAVVVGGGLEARRIPARRPPSLRLGRSARNPRRPLCYPRRPLRIGGRHGGAHRWP